MELKKQQQNNLLRGVVFIASVSILIAIFSLIQYFRSQSEVSTSSGLTKAQEQKITVTLQNATPPPLTPAQQQSIMNNLSR